MLIGCQRCRNLGEALRRVAEGAAMIRTKVITQDIHGQI